MSPPRSSWQRPRWPKQQSSLWNASSGDWSNAANWLSGQWNYSNNLGTGTVIDNGGTANITTAVSDLSNDGNIFLGDAGGSGWVNMTGGTLAGSGSNPACERFGVAAGSGVFTQSGGINSPYAPAIGIDQGNYSALQLGYQDGGYGEYRLSGGTLGVNGIWVGSSDVQQYSGTGVFTQTGGIVGAASQPVSLIIGGGNGSQGGWSDNSTTNAVGTYTLSGSASQFWGGMEVIGASGTGTFIQNGGLNAFVGGGNIGRAQFRRRPI